MKHVLEPIKIGNVLVKNRVVRTAHGTNIGDGRVNDDLIAYHEARARGGVGLTILEAASVHWSDTGTLRVHDRTAIADYRRLMDRLSPFGMKVFQQLGHLGLGGIPMDGSPPWSPSAVAGPASGSVHVMTLGEITEVTDAWIRAANYCQEGGLDGIEIHLAHGFLLQEFMSRRLNKRTDKYGGSWENRLRLTLEVVSGVREAVGADFVVGVRTGSEAIEGGVNEYDCAEVVRELERQDLIDYVNVSYGSVWAPHKIIGGMIEPVGYELSTSAVVTEVSELPTIVSGRFRTLLEADAVIDRGLADLVGMTRAHIADPDLVRKTLDDRVEDIRPCIAANDGCVGGLSRGRLACAMNPAVGFESTYQEVQVNEPKTILVVGGGPAGLEVARVSASRGHQVTLMEKEMRLGGALHEAASLPHRSLFLDAIKWYERQLQQLGVQIRTSEVATVEFAAAVGADAIVIATGASGGTIPHPVPAHATVVDRHGGYEALGIAEWLLDQGTSVALTAASKPGWRVVSDGIVKPTVDRLSAKGAEVRRGDKEEIRSGETTVVITKSPRRELIEPLRAAGYEVQVVGDAASVGGILSAIHSGNEVGRSI